MNFIAMKIVTTMIRPNAVLIFALGLSLAVAAENRFASFVIDDIGGTDNRVSLEKFRQFVVEVFNDTIGHESRENTRGNRSLYCENDVDIGLCEIAQNCGHVLNVEEMERLNGSSRMVTVDDLVKVCPLLLYRIKEGGCQKQHEDAKAVQGQQQSTLEVWGYGLLFVTVINVSSLLGVVLMPMMERKFYNRVLIVLIGLAVGSLSGSAVFHLIPQAYGLVDTNTHHGYLWVSLLVSIGIYSFFMVERLLNIMMYSRKRSRQIRRLARHSSDVSVLPQEMMDSEPGAAANKIKSSDGQHHHIHVQTHKHEHHIEFKPGQDSAIATVAWMIVFGDGIHNFIDGLSIGAAFNQGSLTGVSISLAVLCEELPHELGDFAILLNSGMTMKQALLYNFLSACTCYGGLIVGILLGELAAAGTYIFGLAAGVFLYIALVDMVPEMNEEAEAAGRDGVIPALKVIALQNVGWLSGTLALFLLAYFSDQFNLA